VDVDGSVEGGVDLNTQVRRMSKSCEHEMNPMKAVDKVFMQNAVVADIQKHCPFQ